MILSHKKALAWSAFFNQPDDVSITSVGHILSLML